MTLFAGVDVSFPLTIEFEDGERLAVKSIGEAETQLEWFDSTDPNEGGQRRGGFQRAVGRPGCGGVDSEGAQAPVSTRHLFLSGAACLEGICLAPP